VAEASGEGSVLNSDQGTSRRSFLAGAAGLTGVALSVGAWKPIFAEESPRLVLDAVSTDKRGFTVGKIGLQLNEASAGFLSSADGGNATADVINEKVGSDHLARKHIGAVKYEDITVTAGTGMGKEFYSWIQTSIGGAPIAHTGSILGADVNLKVFTRTDFFNALITEVGMPALDAASKDAAKMTIKFAPEKTRKVLNTGGKLLGGAPLQLKWLTSNFKLTINGLNTSFVNRIEQFTVKANYTRFSGDSATGQRVLSQIDISNLKFTIAEAHAQDFMKWHEDFVINGNNSVENEKFGSLSFLAPDLKTELFNLKLTGLGIFALDPDPLVVSTQGIRHVTAQLYCDKALFLFRA
jgi:hypothetical protein